MRVGRLRNTGRSFCCTRKYRKGRKRRESESKGGNLLNTDLSAKANLSGENRYDSTNLVSKVVGVNKDSFVHAQFVAESQNKADSTSRAGYGFHNDGITGGFLYLDNDHRLKFIDSRGNIGVIVMESP